MACNAAFTVNPIALNLTKAFKEPNSILFHKLRIRGFFCPLFLGRNVDQNVIFESKFSIFRCHANTAASENGSNPNESASPSISLNENSKYTSEVSRLLDPEELSDESSKFFTFKGAKIHYKSAQPFLPMSEDQQKILGDEGTLILNSPAVLLHGFGASSFSWERILTPLASLLGSNVIAFDRPAFGLTSRSLPPTDCKPADNFYSTTFSADATLEFAANLTLNQSPKQNGVVIIGHSAGSIVAVEAVLKSPELCRALILVAPAIMSPSRNSTSKPSGPLTPENEATDNSQPKTILDIIKAAIVSVFLTFREITSQIALSFAQHYQSLKSSLHATHSELMHSKAYRSLASVAAFVKGIIAVAAAQVAFLFVWTLRNMGLIGTQLSRRVSSTAVALVSSGVRSSLGLLLVRSLVNNFGAKAVKIAFHDKKKCSQYVIDGYTKPMRCKDWDIALAEFFLATAFGSVNISSRLHELKCPVLVVTGKDDIIVPSFISKNVAEAIPNAAFKVIKNCGHLPHEEKPEEFVSILREFLAQNVLRV